MKTSSLVREGWAGLESQMPAWPIRVPSSTRVGVGWVVDDGDVFVCVFGGFEVEGDGDGGKMITKARMPLFGDVTIVSR